MTNNIIESISFYCKETEHYGLKILIKFYSNNCLFFDSTNFILLNDGEVIDKLYDWEKINYTALATQNVSIKNIMEDELVSYFIEFSNDDIFHIYEKIYGMGDWKMDFQIVSKTKNLTEYNRIKQYMNEDWVEKAIVK